MFHTVSGIKDHEGFHMSVACLVAFIITYAYGSVKSMDFLSLWLSPF